jgi:Arc/MetJ family transcription regulator
MHCKPSVVIILLILFNSIIYTAPKESPKTYIKQETIDTTVMKGFYVLTEAAALAGVGFRQQEAIQTARRLANDLKRKAKGDPNERYILWKVNELEAQIYLEERDLQLQKQQQGQITVNNLIARYNAEVGKARPDFATLKKIHTQITAIDPAKGNEIADSYNNRYRSISREVIYSIEKCVLAGNDSKAREELGYCLRNKNYLSISNTQYYQIESRVDGLSNAYSEKPLIEKETDSSETAIRLNRFGDARTLLFSAEYRLKNVIQYFPQTTSTPLSTRIIRANRRLSQKEDSLVTINLSILNKNGIKAADEFLQKTLKAYGVSREKTAYVDSVILMIQSPDKKTVMAGELEKLSDADTAMSPQSSLMLDDIKELARAKAQAKADSIRQVDERALQILIAERHKQDSLLAAQRDAELIALQKNQERANAVTMEIYTLIDQNRLIDAENKFRSVQDKLKQFLPAEMYNVLELSLKAVREPVESKGVSYITPVITQTNQVSSSLQTRSDTDSLKKNQERAQKEILSIYNMIENNQYQNAYNRFQSIRAPLQKYLPAEAFEVLEMTVTQALSSK